MRDGEGGAGLPEGMGAGSSGTAAPSENVPGWPLELLRGSQAPHRAVCGTRGCLRTMHGGGSAPSCCAFTHRVAFEEGSGPRVLLKSGPGNRGDRSRVCPALLENPWPGVRFLALAPLDKWNDFVCLLCHQNCAVILSYQRKVAGWH